MPLKWKPTAIKSCINVFALPLATVVCGAALTTCAVPQESGEQPLSDAVLNSALNEIREDITKHPEALAPVQLPVSSPKLLAALESAGIIFVTGKKQSYSSRAKRELAACDDSDSDSCRAVPVGRKRILASPVVKAYRLPRTLGNDEDTFIFFRFAVDWDAKMRGPAIGEGYWVSYNALSSKCPSDLSASTVYLGEYVHHTHDPDIDGPVDTSTRFVPRSEARTPGPNESMCRYDDIKS